MIFFIIFPLNIYAHIQYAENNKNRFLSIFQTNDVRIEGISNLQNVKTKQRNFTNIKFVAWQIKFCI